MNHNENCGLWVIIMCQCSLINCNKCSTLVWDIESVGARDLWEIPVLSADFFCEAKLFLIYKVYRKKTP